MSDDQRNRLIIAFFTFMFLEDKGAGEKVALHNQIKFYGMYTNYEKDVFPSV